jgi:hypothetical protein
MIKEGFDFVNRTIFHTHICGEVGVSHRIIMHFIENKGTSRLSNCGHLVLNTYLSVVCTAAVFTELGCIIIHLFLQICFKSKVKVVY